MFVYESKNVQISNDIPTMAVDVFEINNPRHRHKPHHFYDLEVQSSRTYLVIRSYNGSFRS